MVYLLERIQREKTLFSKDPYCSREHNISLPSVEIHEESAKQLVHMIISVRGLIV
ncbi:MAG: hypothetical protein LBS41_06465 [Streptococcaceae bacterium]|jgi:hypothetical protein|nr:hypothetical protein [Streptococcaceae bacterium]